MGKEEIWIPVIGFEKAYKVSNIGNVVNIRNGRMLKLTKDKKGYVKLTLNFNGFSKSTSAHILVAKAFIPNPKGLPVVNHKNENPSDNYFENLEWCTHEYNLKYGNSKAKRIKSLVNNPKKCTPITQMDLNGNVIKVWPSQAELSRGGIPRTSIQYCMRKDISYKGHKFYKGEKTK